MAYLKDFIEHCVNNSTETMEYYDDITITREYNSPEMEEFRKIVNEHFNRFCFNNGLFQKNRLRFEYLDQTQKAFLTLIGVNTELPKNRYLQHILKFYFSKLDSKLEDIKLEDLRVNGKWIMDDYYSDVPPIYAKIPKLSKDSILQMKRSGSSSERIENVLKHLREIIIIGSSVQFNVDGFPRNEMLYLLYGLAIVSAWNRLNSISSKFKTFKEMINYLKSFIQLYLTSKCFNPIPECEEDLKMKDKDNYYNLITYLKMKREDSKEGRFNYRYTCAAKYFKGECVNGNTKMVKSEDGSEYLLTVYKTKEEMEKVWNELEEEFSKSDLSISDELIKKWFDGQLLTRSTCLIGCMLIIMKELKNGKRVVFKKDEMPDWCSIAGLDFKDTLELEDLNLKIPEINDLTLNDVLNTLRIYFLNLRK
jgi:hypothetical protein